LGRSLSGRSLSFRLIWKLLDPTPSFANVINELESLQAHFGSRFLLDILGQSGDVDG
jgi:hypothetical protein